MQQHHLQNYIEYPQQKAKDGVHEVLPKMISEN